MASGTPYVRAGVVPRRALYARLAEAERFVQISAPAGSGKTVLMRSWIAEAGLAARTAWVPVDSEQRDPRWFWISVADALRGTAAGSALVRPLTAASGLDGWAMVERLLKDLARLEDRLWVMIDDAHLLDRGEVLAQLKLLMLRTPPELRFVLAARRDLGLGLRRLGVAGELTEIRATDLRFSLAEARALFTAAGVELPEEALARLHDRTEGWAAGLRLAALSLAGHPAPEQFAAEFSGADRTVAEFLLAEVLDRQSEAARRLLVRTSLLERVSGPLADVLTGGSGGQRILRDLERAGAFVVSLDASRTWFRYHRLFADLLQLELRRTEPNERAALHGAAAGWLAEHGHGAEAVRQAQAAEDWGTAARLLSDYWLDLYLAGRGGVLVELLDAFPRRVVAASPELTALQAAGDLVRGALEEAGQHLAMADGALAAVPADRRRRVEVMLSVLRSFLAACVVDVPAAAEVASGTLAGDPAERLTDSEARILRYLPTHLTARDIASELFLSVHTVGTHTRHLYAKLGVHSRQEAVDRGRALGLLAPGIARDPADGPPRDLPGGRLIFRLPGDELQDAGGRQVLRVTRRAAAPVRRLRPRRDAPSPWRVAPAYRTAALGCPDRFTVGGLGASLTARAGPGGL